MLMCTSSTQASTLPTRTSTARCRATSRACILACMRVFEVSREALQATFGFDAVDGASSKKTDGNGHGKFLPSSVGWRRRCATGYR